MKNILINFAIYILRYFKISVLINLEITNGKVKPLSNNKFLIYDNDFTNVDFDVEIPHKQKFNYEIKK